MRGIRGWIRNLSDGLGPAVGSVTVHATVDNGDAELDNTTHQTGVLQRIHALGGSGSNTLADPFGHFGWNMELAPGAMTQEIIPSDPQMEFRYRFPDESAQVGKAFHTDLERLAWTAGRDGLVWNAIPGGNDPASASAWSNDPTNALSWGVGNGSIASFGPTAGKVTLRPFIGFVGGTVFSVEIGDLEVPPAGGTVLPSNGGGSDRWDLLLLKTITAPTDEDYGKQTIELLQGTPGAGIPTHPGQTSGVRILPMFALKKAPGATAYSDAYDLRRWLFHPAQRAVTKMFSAAGQGPMAVGVETASVLNTAMASAPLILPPGVAYEGSVVLNIAWIPQGATVGQLSAAVISEAVDPVSGTVVAGSGALISGMVNPAPTNINSGGYDSVALTFPLSTVPSYHLDSGAISDSRSWAKLRFRVVYLPTLLAASIGAQQLRVHCWPAR